MIIVNTLKRFGGAFGSPDDERNLVGSARLSAAEAHSALLHEAVVLSEQQMLVDLRHRVERDTDNDQQRRSTKAERNVDRVGDEHGQQRDECQEQRTRERDARYDVINVLGRLLPGFYARNETALFLQVLGDVDRVEDDRRVEVGEENDQNSLQQVIQPGSRCDLLRPLAGDRAAAELGDRTRHDDHRRRKDDWHHAGGVDAQRNEVLRGLPLATTGHSALRDLDHHPPRGNGDCDRPCDYPHHDEAEDDERERPDSLGLDEAEGAEDTRPEPLDDREENDQRRAVAETSLGNLFAQPHHEDRAGGQNSHHLQLESESRIDDCVLEGRRKQRESPTLHTGQNHRSVTGPLRHFLPAFLVLLHLLDRRDDRTRDLEEDARGDVRHDSQREDRRVRQSTADEQVVQPEKTALSASVGEEVGQRDYVYARRRDVRADSVDHKTEESEDDLVPQFRRVVDVAYSRRWS